MSADRRIGVRAAAPADARGLAELRWEFRAPRADTLEGQAAFVARCESWMRERLSGDGWRCWVAERSGAIVGQVWASLVEKIPNPVDEPERHGYITNMYVREDARGGTGTALLNRALAWCTEQDVDEVILWTTPLSRTLYQRHGFGPGDRLMTRLRKA